MLLCDPGGPGLNGRRFHFNRLAAVAAQQVMVVPGDGAAPVDGLAVGVAEDVNQSVLGQRLQNPVGGGKGNGAAPLVQDAVKFLRAHEVGQLVEGGRDRQALFGNPLLLACGGDRGRCPAAVGGGALGHGGTHFAVGFVGGAGNVQDYQPGVVDTPATDP